jgi:predicted RNA-binding Zn ribbon-like protein
MPAPFQLIAGHPVLDFINTLDNRFIGIGPNELLVGYADLVKFIVQAGLLEAKRANTLAIRDHSAAATRSLTAAHELREALATLLYGRCNGSRAPPSDVLKALECHFVAAESHRELTWIPQRSGKYDRARLAWDWGRYAKSPGLPVWVLAQSAQQLLTSDSMDRVHVCKSDTCRWLFLDSSKNHSRVWCDMKICGNRMKARTFQARRSLPPMTATKSWR